MKGDQLPPAQQVLLEEACRITDRLDKLDALLGGDAEDWLALVEDKGDPDRQIVVIDRPLAEARQQATALKQLLVEIRAAGAGKPGLVPGGPVSSGGAAPVDQIAQRRAERRRQATGR
jgi:hypothetical protein